MLWRQFNKQFCIINILIQYCIITIVRDVNGITYLKPRNERGPIAWNAGANCLSIIEEIYFYNPTIQRTKILEYVFIKNLTSPASQISELTLNLLHTQLLNYQIIVDNTGYELTNYGVNGATRFSSDYCIMVIDDVADLKTAMISHVKRMNSFNPAAEYLVLFNNPSFNGNHKEVARTIMTTLTVGNNAPNNVILFAKDYVTYEIFMSNTFYNDADCHKVEASPVGLCTNGKLDDPIKIEMELRKIKLPNEIPRCRLNICASISEPYVQPGCMDGLEFELMKTIQSKMKFQANVICSRTPRGVVFENGTWSGFMGQIRQDICDLVVGGFYPDNEISDDFGVTETYLQDSYTWYVFRPPFKETWKSLIGIFKTITWIVFIWILIITGACWAILARLSNEHKPHREFVLAYLATWAIFLGQSAYHRPYHQPLRIFFIFLALYGLNVTTIYTSNLINVFTSPARENQIDTVQEMLDSGLPIGGRLEYADWFENDDSTDLKISKRYNSSDDFLPTRRNLYAVRNGKRIILFNRFFVDTTSISRDVFGFTENVFSNPLEMITERGASFLPRFNMIISRMKDSGLTIKIYNDFLYKIKILQEIEFIKNNGPREVLHIVLTPKHLQGSFSILICGLIISTIVFIGELLYNRFLNRHKTTELIYYN